jgi:Fe-S oxidoreductase
MQGAREPYSLSEENLLLQITHSHLVACVNIGMCRYQCINDIKIAFVSCRVEGRPAILQETDAGYKKQYGARSLNSQLEEHSRLQITHSHLAGNVNVGMRCQEFTNDLKMPITSCRVEGRPAILQETNAGHKRKL